MKLTPEEQAEVDQIFSKIYAGLPPEAKAKIDQIKAEGAQEIRDLEIEFEARIKQLLRGSCRLIPIAELAWSAVFAAREAEPLESRKGLAAYESGRAFIRAIKAALMDGSLVAREQGSGIPVSDRAWCLEKDTLLSLPKMMPHDRLMVRTDEAKAWLEKMGVSIDAVPLMQLAAEGIRPMTQDSTKAEPENPAGEQAEIDRKETGDMPAPKRKMSAEERGKDLTRRANELGGRSKAGTIAELARQEGCSESNIKRLLNEAQGREKKMNSR